MTEERLVQERLRMLPPIRRARLWRLYAENGKRFLDFWMEGGRSILGAKGTGLGTAAKAAVDMGLTRPFPSVREARLVKTALKSYPGYAALRLYRNEERARAAAATVSPNAPIAVLKPFAEHLNPEAPKARIALPILPCPSALAPAILLFEDECDAASADAAGAGGDLLPPLPLECAHRALCELEKFRLTYKEELWKRSDRRLKASFERRGPYLIPRCEEADYGRLFEAALGAGALLSPAFEEPSILPGDFDDGELMKLAAALDKKDGPSLFHVGNCPSFPATI